MFNGLGQNKIELDSQWWIPSVPAVQKVLGVFYSTHSACVDHDQHLHAHSLYNEKCFASVLRRGNYYRKWSHPPHDLLG